MSDGKKLPLKLFRPLNVIFTGPTSGAAPRRFLRPSITNFAECFPPK